MKYRKIIVIFAFIMFCFGSVAYAESTNLAVASVSAQTINNAVVVDVTLENPRGLICAALIDGDTTVAIAMRKAETNNNISFKTEKTGDTVKIFIWESIEKLKPLCNVEVTDVLKNKFSGKKLYVDGDSICYGNGYKGGFGRIIADKYDMELTNTGVGGATISNMGATNNVKWGDEMDWDNTQYYLKLTGFDPYNNKGTEGFAYPLTQSQYESGFGVYPTTYKMIDGEMVEQEYSETMPTSTFFVKFDVPTYDDNTVPKYYRMWATNSWLWEAYNSGFKSVHESGEATIAIARHWLSTSVNTVDTSADYIIFEGGINDYIMNRPLGEITADKTEVVDTTTVIGGLEYICRTLLEKCPDSKILYVVTPRAREYTTKPNGNVVGNKTWQEYHDAIIMVLEKYNIDYVDLFETEFDTAKEEYLIYTNKQDGVHPTKEGYELFFVPYIVEAMDE